MKRKRKILRLVLRPHRMTWGLLLWLLLAASGIAQTTSVPPSRLAHLKHGINVGRIGGQDTPQCCSSDAEADHLKALGFDHVRITLRPGFLFNFKRSEVIPADRLAGLDRVIQRFVSKDIAVVITISLDEDQFQNKLERGSEFVEQFADFWRTLAQHYASNFSPDSIFFDILNEPALPDPYRWSGIQAKLAASIRMGAPQNTIVATGAAGSHADGLLFLEPLRDGNVVYSFHYYEPYVFTHQGADWATNYWHYLANVRYPSTAEDAKRVAEQVPPSSAADRLYLLRELELFNGAAIQTDFDQISQWAKRQNVPVICNEFGVETKAPAADRAAWVRDVRTALERDAVSWTYWDYNSETFGITEDIVAALGLKATAIEPAHPGR